MDTETRLSGFGLALLGGFLALVVAFAVNASIGDGSGATRISPVDPQAITRLAARGAAIQASVALAGVPRNTAPSGTRAKLYCAGCGVVELVRRMDRRETAPEVCHAVDSEHLWMRGNGREETTYGGGGTLFSIDDGAVAGRPGARRMITKSTYQIVVRLRDGSRQVFNEATPRTLQRGERVQVIADADLSPKGRA